MSNLSVILNRSDVPKSHQAEYFDWDGIISGEDTFCTRDEMIIIIEVGLKEKLRDNPLLGQSWDFSAQLRGSTKEWLNKEWLDLTHRNKTIFKKLLGLAYITSKPREYFKSDGEYEEYISYLKSKAVLRCEGTKDFLMTYKNLIFNKEELKKLQQFF
jgi:hypothetical protein